MIKKNVVEVGGTNNRVSVGHVGDVSINQAPTPALQLSARNVTQNSDGTFATRIPAEVIAPYPPGSLRIEAWAPGILALEVAPQRTGAVMSGHCGIRDDHAFHTAMNPFGHYMLQVQTRQLVDIDIRYTFNV